MAGRSSFSDPVTKNNFIEALIKGSTVDELRTKFNIGETTVHHWYSRVNQGRPTNDLIPPPRIIIKGSKASHVTISDANRLTISIGNFDELKEYFKPGDKFIPSVNMDMNDASVKCIILTPYKDENDLQDDVEEETGDDTPPDETPSEDKSAEKGKSKGK